MNESGPTSMRRLFIMAAAALGLIVVPSAVFAQSQSNEPRGLSEYSNAVDEFADCVREAGASQAMSINVNRKGTSKDKFHIDYEINVTFDEHVDEVLTPETDPSGPIVASCFSSRLEPVQRAYQSSQRGDNRALQASMNGLAKCFEIEERGAAVDFNVLVAHLQENIEAPETGQCLRDYPLALSVDDVDGGS